MATTNYKRKATEKEKKLLDELTDRFESEKAKKFRNNELLRVLKVAKYVAADTLFHKPAIDFYKLSALPIFSGKKLKIILRELSETLTMASADLSFPDGTIIRIFKPGSRTFLVFAVFTKKGRWVLRLPADDTSLDEHLAGQRREVSDGFSRFMREEYCGVDLQALLEVADNKEKKAVRLIGTSEIGGKISRFIYNVAYSKETGELVIIDLS